MKKRILIIIAIIMIISTIIRTLIVGYSFLSYSKEIIQNESALIADIVMETTDKNKIINLIKYSKPINDVKFISGTKKGIIFDLNKKTIISFYPIGDKTLEIVYNGEIFLKKFKNAITQLLLIAFFSLILIIAIVNYFLNPYLEILESVKKSTKNILNGNFDYRLSTKLKGEAKNFIDSFNTFLDNLKESFNVIEENYTSFIEKKPTQNPLIDTKETIEQLANIFKFKRVIEDDMNETIILDRIANLIEKFNISHYALIGINNHNKKIFYIRKKGDICCSIEDNYTLCRAYRLKHEIDSKNYENLCTLHSCNNDYYCIPFSAEGNFTGILKIMDKNIKETLPYIKAYLKEASTIIESKTTLNLLKKQNIKDALTGLYNRRYLDEILPKILANANRNHSKVGFLMIDIDYFKKINDTYGHDIGDKVLKETSFIILNSIRKSDIAIRLGGEEFLVILTNIKDAQDAYKVAQKIRQNIQKRKISNINITASIGISIYPDLCKDSKTCIKYADLALYKAKNSGRNQVIIFNENLKTTS